MGRQATRTEWSPWHLHLGSNARSLHDRVLTDVIGPAIGLVAGRPWFFIRYWQAGAHLRLRIGNLDPISFDRTERFLTERLAVVGQLADDEEPIDEAEYRNAASRFAAGERGEDRFVQELLPSGVYRAGYEPEFDRYGGPELMPRTERLFQLSSELVLALLPHLGTARSRSVMALRGTMSAAAALGDGAAQAYFYARGLAAWRSWAAEFGCPEDQLELLCRITHEPGSGGGKPVDPVEHGPFGVWHTAIVDLVAEIPRQPSTPAGQIVSSHVHMLHNRLGLSLFDELRTYAWLADAFPAPGARQ